MTNFQDFLDAMKDLNPPEHEQINQAEQEQWGVIRGVIGLVDPLENILEIGTGGGVFSIAALYGNNAKLTTIDPKEEIPDFERRTAKVGIRDRIQRLVGRSGANPSNPKYASKESFILDKLPGPYDLIYIDGSHNYEDVKYDLESCWTKIRPGGTILLDDYYHRKNYENLDYGVAKAVSEVSKANYKNYTVYAAASGMVRFDF